MEYNYIGIDNSHTIYEFVHVHEKQNSPQIYHSNTNVKWNQQVGRGELLHSPILLVALTVSKYAVLLRAGNVILSRVTPSRLMVWVYADPALKSVHEPLPSPEV